MRISLVVQFYDVLHHLIRYGLFYLAETGVVIALTRGAITGEQFVAATTSILTIAVTHAVTGKRGDGNPSRAEPPVIRTVEERRDP